ncbi:type IV pilin protein [Lysobacter sp. TAB13]
MRTRSIRRAPSLERGFTLMELMVVVAIVGILAGIAIPTYQDSVRKSRRGQAKADLVEAAQAMERYYTVNGSYAGASLLFNRSPQTGDIQYAIAFDKAPTAQKFGIKATPQGPQTKDRCGELSIDSTGVKRPDDPACWQ